MPLLGCFMHMTKTLFFRLYLHRASSSSFFFFPFFTLPLSFVFSFFHAAPNINLFHIDGSRTKLQVSVNDEGRGMWKVYLDMKEYAAALANCRDPLQRDQVYLVQVNLILFCNWSTCADKGLSFLSYHKTFRHFINLWWHKCIVYVLHWVAKV